MKIEMFLYLFADPGLIEDCMSETIAEDDNAVFAELEASQQKAHCSSQKNPVKFPEETVQSGIKKYRDRKTLYQSFLKAAAKCATYETLPDGTICHFPKRRVLTIDEAFPDDPNTPVWQPYVYFNPKRPGYKWPDMKSPDYASAIARLRAEETKGSSSNESIENSDSLLRSSSDNIVDVNVSR